MAAARKLAGIIWKMLTTGLPYQEENKDLTDRKMVKMSKIAKKPSPIVKDDELSFLAEDLGSKCVILEQMTQVENHDDKDTEK